MYDTVESMEELSFQVESVQVISKLQSINIGLYTFAMVKSIEFGVQ